MWNNLLRRFLRKSVSTGSLTVRFADGTLETYGNGQDPKASVTLHDPALPGKILRSPDLAVGEAYMDGRLTIEDDDLYGFLSIGILNLGRNSGRFDNPAPGARMLKGLSHLKRRLSQYNPMGKAQQNVAHHYDLSDDLYDLFLDEGRQYSCGYYKTENDTLEQAQAQKKELIAKKLMLEPDMLVLDIGCGWGGLALTLAKDYGVKVVGVTLSVEQHKYAVSKAEEDGFSDRVEYRLQDYRLVEETFDRIVSVGMFEHVGVPHYGEYFGAIRNLLRPDGVALVHTIGRCAPPNVTSPWIAKYIFPGGYVPAMSEVVKVIETENLVTADIEIWRMHYAETLKDWRIRFDANEDKVRGIYDERFCRMWRYYLIASELTFRLDRQAVFQFQLTHNQTAVPVTRDYLYAD